MILFANLLLALAKIIRIVGMIYLWIMVFRAILSWVQIPSLYSVSVILYHLTEPVLRPVRRFVPPHKLGGIDISPMIVIIIMLFIDSFVLKSMSLYAQQILRREVLPYY